MSTDKLEPVYLLHGGDTVKQRNAMQRMRGYFDEDGIEHFDAANTGAADVIETCRMVSLLAERKLVIVLGVDVWKVPDVDALLGYLADPEPSTVLLMTATALPSNGRLWKACQKPPVTVVACEGPSGKQVVAWATKNAQTLGTSIDSRTAAYLVDRAGIVRKERGKEIVNLQLLGSELAKLAAYAAGEPITRQMVDDLCTVSDEMAVFAISDAWASRNRAQLLGVSERLLAKREDPVRLATLLAGHIARVHQAERLIDAGHGSDAVARSLGGHPFQAKNCVRQAQQIRSQQRDPSRARPLLDASLARVALLDAELKGDSALASNKDGVKAAFQRALSELV